VLVVVDCDMSIVNQTVCWPKIAVFCSFAPFLYRTPLLSIPSVAIFPPLSTDHCYGTRQTDIDEDLDN
jgi:hypothetical protein